MTYRISRVSIGQLTLVLSILYAIFGVIFIPFFVIMAMVDPDMGALGAGFAIFMPVFYAVIGAVGAVIGGGLYNLIAKGVGGIEFNLEEPPVKAAPHQQQPPPGVAA